MTSNSRPYNRLMRVIAFLVLASFACPFVFSPIAPIALLCGVATLAGLLAATTQLVHMWRERPGRYDLNELQRVMDHDDLDEEEADRYDRNLALCHHCGTACADFHSICPSCGTPLGR